MDYLAHTSLNLCLINILLVLENAVSVRQLLANGFKPRITAFESAGEREDGRCAGAILKALLQSHQVATIEHHYC